MAFAARDYTAEYAGLLQRARTQHAQQTGQNASSTSARANAVPWTDTLPTNKKADAGGQMAIDGILQRETDESTRIEIVRNPAVEYLVREFRTPAARSIHRATAATITEGLSVSSLFSRPASVYNIVLAFGNVEKLQCFDVICTFLNAIRRCSMCQAFFSYIAPSMCPKSTIPVHSSISTSCVDHITSSLTITSQHSEIFDDFVELLRRFKLNDAVAHAQTYLPPVLFEMCKRRLVAGALATDSLLPAAARAFSSDYDDDARPVAPCYALPLSLCDTSHDTAMWSLTANLAYNRFDLVNQTTPGGCDNAKVCALFDCDREHRRAVDQSRSKKNTMGWEPVHFLQQAVDRFMAYSNGRANSNTHRILVNSYAVMQTFRHFFYIPGGPRVSIDLLEVYCRCIMSNAQFDDIRWGHAAASGFARDASLVLDDTNLFVPFLVLFNVSFLHAERRDGTGH